MRQNPLTAVFNAQRTVLEQSLTLTHDVTEVQETSISIFADVVQNAESLVEHNAELTKGVIHAYFNAIETTLPENAAEFDAIHQLVDEQFDAATETQIQSLETFIDGLEESETVYDEVASNYVEVIDSQFDTFLDAHEQVQATTVEVAETVEAGGDEAEDEFDTAA